jgi:hypothetical protein
VPASLFFRVGVAPKESTVRVRYAKRRGHQRRGVQDMRPHVTTAALGISLAMQPLSDVSATVYAKTALLGPSPLIQQVQAPDRTPQHRAPAWRGRPGPGPAYTPAGRAALAGTEPPLGVDPWPGRGDPTGSVEPGRPGRITARSSPALPLARSSPLRACDLPPTSATGTRALGLLRLKPLFPPADWPKRILLAHQSQRREAVGFAHAHRLGSSLTPQPSSGSNPSCAPGTLRSMPLSLTVCRIRGT